MVDILVPPGRESAASWKQGMMGIDALKAEGANKFEIDIEMTHFRQAAFFFKYWMSAADIPGKLKIYGKVGLENEWRDITKLLAGVDEIDMSPATAPANFGYVTVVDNSEKFGGFSTIRLEGYIGSLTETITVDGELKKWY